MLRRIIILCWAVCSFAAYGQINVDQVVRVGRNAMYFEDYVLSIQYFNQAIDAKPYLAKPYFYRAVAKYNLDDMRGAAQDATMAIERNPYITDAYEVRGVARQNLGDAKGAIEDYRKVLEQMPVNRGVLLNMAMAQDDTGDREGAMSTYQRLLKSAPGSDRAHLGLARLKLNMKDTVGALESVEKVLQLNKFNIGGLVMKAELYMSMPDSLNSALALMDEAIRLDPHNAGFFINRAFMRYRLDDYYGAMGDYDYALQLDPHSAVAYYNRALLRMEVGDFDKAIGDLDKVIALNGRDYRALYNRALVNKSRGDYEDALKDADAVIEAFPDLAAAWFLRFDVKQAKGDRAGAKADYDKSLELARHKVKKRDAADGTLAVATSGTNNNEATADEERVDEHRHGLLDTPEEENQEAVAARFTSLLTVNTNSHNDPGLDMSGQAGGGPGSIRGRVQNAGWDLAVEMEPIFTATYYSMPTELKPSGDYMNEVDEVNRTRSLRFLLQVTNREASLADEAEIRRHFESVDYYTAYISTHTPRAIDYFGRGMDFMTVRNFAAAINDFSEAIKLTPDFTLAWLMRSVAEAKSGGATAATTESDNGPVNKGRVEQIAATRRAIADLDKVIELSPNMAIAYYNKGVMLAELEDFTSAIAAFGKAIELKPDMGEAFYNRGYCYFKLGNAASGSSDLSRAGELGVVNAYSLLKRMNR
ncbi:MAG: tetratricopeptide repeat protein [Paramuribaculum sp.]|nr:tetratricopeptide repeat protein [Paramuribaculum sp.]